ncbi:uncharacterized protein LOC141718453 [Apium graveolens]|uniref:uncharacterized protein LOC141718453 n=1 Tax=Apium graveolens TaxID=4045 RepID=UPI003D7BD6D7
MNALKRLLSQRQQHSQEESEIMNTMVTEAAMVMDFIDTSDEAEGRGSRPSKSPNHHRQRLSRGKNLMEDYFVDRPIFTYGAAADQCAEICGMGESTTLECMKKFYQQVEGLFGEEYLRATTPADLRRLVARGEQKGFPGMIGSIDCMHWEWKNCPSGWGGAYSGRKGCPTIILEAVAFYDTWVWHTFFGVLGAKNDINVLGQSPVFDKVVAGNSPIVVFHVNGKRYNNVYYLADGIYLKYSTFVKTISNPATQS